MAEAALAGLLAWSAAAATPSGAPLPERLSETGLYADAPHRRVAPANLPYSPQYPLWTDGAAKRRWIYLPPGTSIDGSDPDAWVFPIGTKLWKEFSFGRPVETRLLERVADGSWRYAAYVWQADGSDATLAPARGVRGAATIAAGVRHDVPSRFDCGACHEGQPTPVLGFAALQLSPDRDPLAPHADRRRPGDVDLATLMRAGLVRGLPTSFLSRPPRIATTSATERAALGYLHANCGHCHNDRGPLASLGMNLAVRLAAAHGPYSEVLLTAVGRASSYPLPGTVASGLYPRIANGAPGESVLVQRMVSRQPAVQMPPLGTHLVDEQALRLVMSWIRVSLTPTPAAAAVSAAEHLSAVRPR